MALLITPATRNGCESHELAAVVCTSCGGEIHLDARSPRLRRLVHGLARAHRCFGR